MQGPHMLKQQLLAVDSFKRFVSYTRCAEYPDIGKFDAERPHIEKAWPAYEKDDSLCRLPEFSGAARAQTVQHGRQHTTCVSNMSCRG